MSPRPLLQWATAVAFFWIACGEGRRVRGGGSGVGEEGKRGGVRGWGVVYQNTTYSRETAKLQLWAYGQSHPHDKPHGGSGR